jgi:hypothetical protein
VCTRCFVVCCGRRDFIVVCEACCIH